MDNKRISLRNSGFCKQIQNPFHYQTGKVDLITQIPKKIHKQISNLRQINCLTILNNSKFNIPENIEEIEKDLLMAKNLALSSMSQLQSQNQESIQFLKIYHNELERLKDKKKIIYTSSISENKEIDEQIEVKKEKRGKKKNLFKDKQFMKKFDNFIFERQEANNIEKKQPIIMIKDKENQLFHNKEFIKSFNAFIMEQQLSEIQNSYQQ